MTRHSSRIAKDKDVKTREENVNAGNTKKTARVPPSKYASIYYDPSHPHGYSGGATTLAKAAGGSVEGARRFLASQDVYTLYRQARRRFKHPRIYVEAMDHQWEADLVDVQSISSDNDGYKYILTVIDSLSKHAWARPIRDKTAATTAGALSSIFEEGRVPRRLRSDRGKEFMGAAVQRLLSDKNVMYFTSENPTKSAIVERFNRTLRGRMWRFFEATNTRRYTDVLQRLVGAYNDRVHRTTGMAPSKVTVLNEHKVWKRLYGSMMADRKRQRLRDVERLKKLEKKKPMKKGEKKAKKKKNGSKKSLDSELRVGDMVRISRAKGLFEQGYKRNWSREVFVIAEVLTLLSEPVRYKIVDLDKDVILGSFQKEELQKVYPSEKQIQEVVKYVPGGKYVRWRGLPKTLTTWVPRAGGRAAAANIPETK